MKVLFHVGWNKAGSSTIQESLAAASAALATKGVYYPCLAGGVSHTRLLFADAADDELTRFHGRGTAAGQRASRSKALRMWQEIEQEVQRTRPSLMILSTEFGVGLRRVSWLRLAERLRRLADSLDIVAYVRSPAAHYLSAVQQGVKFSDRIKDPTNRVRYKAELRKLQGLGWGEVIVRSYDRREFPAGCIGQDFVRNVARLGEEIAELVRVKTTNETLSAQSMAVLQAFNHANYPGQVRSGSPLGDDLVEALKRVEGGGVQAAPKLKEAVRTLIENDMRAEMVWLREATGVTFADFPYDRAREEDGATIDLRERHDRLELSDVVDVDATRVPGLRAALHDDLLAKSPRSFWASAQDFFVAPSRAQVLAGDPRYYHHCRTLLRRARRAKAGARSS